jgi:phage tail sheath protein FI
MPIFVGFTEKAQAVEMVDDEQITHDLLGKPQLVTNWSQFVESFGGFVEGAYLPHSVYGYFLNGGSRCYVISVKTLPKAQTALLNSEGKPQLIVQAKQAGFDGMQLRVSVDVEAAKASKSSKSKSKGKDEDKDSGAAEESDLPPFTITVEKQKASGGWQTKEVLQDAMLVEEKTEEGKQVFVAFKDDKLSDLIDILIPEGSRTPLNKLWPVKQEQPLAIESKLLAPAAASDFRGEVTERTGIEGIEALDDVTMLVVPDLMTPMPGQDLDLDTIKSVQSMMIAHCEKMGDRVAILDAPPNMKPQEIKKWRMDVAGYDSSYATLYYPWIQISDPVTDRSKLVPPSGHMAGIWARSDNTKGVHKAPANEIVRGATGLAYNVTKGEQDVLNPDGINCIRAFPGMGIRVWGARTLSSDPAWRYLNVRRLFNYVEKSIERGTQWVVFEPNDPRLWARVKRDVTAFLSMVWRDGALFGNAPSEAFYVKCDSELNPSESRDLGRLVIEIGLSPVKPAEFVIFRISQWAGQ